MTAPTTSATPSKGLQVRPGAAYAAILGVGAYRPERVVPNSELVEAIDSSDEWIQQRTGIKERRFASAEETVQMMSVAASRQALERAGIGPEDVDAVLVATVSHFMQLPALAPLVADELGCPAPAAFDLAAACAGFCHGVALAQDMIRGGSARHVLVIGVEKLSDMLDLTDRGTAFIFADGAGAVVVGPSDVAGIGPVVWGSDGEQYDLIRSREDWRDVLAADTAVMPHLTMQGSAVFRWASFAMAKVGVRALEAAGVAPADLDVFVPHQANMRITDAMARTMKLSPEVVVARDIAHQGNTSAASIPLALARLVDDGEVSSGQTALLIGFGSGLSYAAQVVVLP